MHHWTDLAESFLKMYGFAMLRTAGQNLYQVYHCVHYFVLFIIYVSTGIEAIGMQRTSNSVMLEMDMALDLVRC